jgi:hypothetical protein
MTSVAEYVDGLPNISGSEPTVEDTIRRGAGQAVFAGENRIDFNRIRSAAAIALHMHQPLIPAGGSDLRTAAIISNLQYMMEHKDVGDNHNAPVFHWCYRLMGEFVPQLIDEGLEPRVMLEYSGTLLHGLRVMGFDDVFDNLRRITSDRKYRRAAGASAVDCW